MKQNIRILLHGFINLNIMDGSAVFTTGLAKMLAQHPNITVDLVLANPVQRDILLKELYEIENINIISPFDDEQLTASKPKWLANRRFTHEEAANMLDFYWSKEHYDWMIVRGMDVVKKLYEVNPEIFPQLMTYVTGITADDQVIPEQEMAENRIIFNHSAYLLCQTDEMRNYLNRTFSDVPTRIITLNPMIPDTTTDFDEVFVNKERYDKLCYVGKFHHDWNSIPMIVGFREVRETHPDATFLIAGDKFTVHPEYPTYNDDLKYLLGNTENLTWYGALSREDSRALIMEGDIGLTWRDENMNKSLELSTKLLEYGSFGKAVIMNRTPMHEKIFGEDYPLYVSSLLEFETAVNAVIEDPALYYKAAKRMFDSSQNFTYTQTLNKLTPYLFASRLDDFLAEHGYTSNGEWSADETTMPLTGKDAREYLLVKFAYKDTADLVTYLNTISEQGEIVDYYQENNALYTVIAKTAASVQENLQANINTNIFRDVLKFAAKQSESEYRHALEMQQLKRKSKLQFGLSENKAKAKVTPHNGKQRAARPSASQKRMKELEQIERKYQALANSKLGKMQLNFWKRKK